MSLCDVRSHPSKRYELLRLRRIEDNSAVRVVQNDVRHSPFSPSSSYATQVRRSTKDTSNNKTVDSEGPKLSRIQNGEEYSRRYAGSFPRCVDVFATMLCCSIFVDFAISAQQRQQ